jgi:hypothetical protein
MHSALREVPICQESTGPSLAFVHNAVRAYRPPFDLTLTCAAPRAVLVASSDLRRLELMVLKDWGYHQGIASCDGSHVTQRLSHQS